MKRKKINVFITICLALACSLLVLPRVLAGGNVNPGGGADVAVSGKAVSGGGSGMGIASDYGFVVSLQPVNNAVSNSDKTKISKSNLTVCTYQVSKSLMYNFPTNLTGASTAGSSVALIRRNGIGNSGVDAGIKSVIYTAGSRGIGKSMDAYLFEANVSYRDLKWNPKDGPLYKHLIELQAKVETAGNLKALAKAKGNLSDFEDRKAKIPVDIEKGYNPKTSAYVQSVKQLFADYGNSYSYINEQLAKYSDEERLAIYFDLCAAINSLCNHAFDTELKNLYKNKNADNAKQFLSIVVEPVCVVSAEPATEPVIYNLPSYFAAAYNKDISSFTDYSDWNKGRTEIDYFIKGKKAEHIIQNNMVEYYNKFLTKFYFNGSDNWYKELVLREGVQNPAKTIYDEMSNTITTCSIWFNKDVWDVPCNWNYQLGVSAFACNALGEGVGGIGYSYFSASPQQAEIIIEKPKTEKTRLQQKIETPELSFKFSVSEMENNGDGTGTVKMKLDFTQAECNRPSIITYYNLGDLYQRILEKYGCSPAKYSLDCAAIKIEIARAYKYNKTDYNTSTAEISLGKVVDTITSGNEFITSGRNQEIPNSGVNWFYGIHDGEYSGSVWEDEEIISTIVLNQISQEGLEQLIEGKTVISLVDSNIPIPEAATGPTEVEVDYYANVFLRWPSGELSAMAPDPTSEVDEMPSSLSTLRYYNKSFKNTIATIKETIYKVNTIEGGKVTSSKYCAGNGPCTICGGQHLLPNGWAGLFGDDDSGNVPDQMANTFVPGPETEPFIQRKADIIKKVPQIWIHGAAEVEDTPIPPPPQVYERYFYDSFKSIPKQAFAEIKQGAPYAEQYEAMAGTPTDASLYFTLGGTLAVANMGIELKEDFDGAVRNYIYKMTFTNCIDENEKCTWTCSGHELSIGGCGDEDAFCTHELNDVWVDDVVDPDTGDVTEPGHYTDHTHTAACGCNSGETITYYCNEQGENGCNYHQVKCKCGATENHVDAGSLKPTGGQHISCIGKVSGAPHCTGYGCVHNEKVNEAHPTTREFTGTCTQPIGEYVYGDIEKLDVWTMDTSRLHGNPDLFTVPEQWSSINVGYQTYYNIGEYEPNNGRIKFQTVVGDYTNPNNTPAQLDGDKNIWGDITYTCTDDKIRLGFSGDIDGNKNCDQIATDWFNSQISVTESTATVISDYALLFDDPIRNDAERLNKRYQSLMYHDYTSDKFKLTNGAKFSLGGCEKIIGSDVKVNFTNAKDYLGKTNDFSQFSQSSWDCIWRDNTNSTYGKLPSEFMQYGGYNGNYAGAKYSNAEYLTTITNADQLFEDQQPNLMWEKDRIYSNKEAGWPLNTIVGLTVHKNTFPHEYNGFIWPEWWEGSDTLNPVPNGLWDTGRATVQYVRKITYTQEPQEGVDGVVDVYYSDTNTTIKYYKGLDVYNIKDNQWDDILCKEQNVPYALDGDYTTEINDIVIYNPLALSAYVETCPEYLDDRIKDDAVQSDAEHNYPETAYTLSCTESPRLHDDNCYITTTVSDTCTGITNTHTCTAYCRAFGCTGELNTHVCTDACNKRTIKTLICNNPHHYSAGEAWDSNDVHNHYAYGDSRCWTSTQVDHTTVTGVDVDKIDTFVSLDHDFRIHYTYLGHIYGNGQANLNRCDTGTLGKGWPTDPNEWYDTSRYVREPYAMFPFDVMGPDGKIYLAGTWIHMRPLPSEGDGWYRFHCLEDNYEAKKVTVKFFCSAINEQEVLQKLTNPFNTNLLPRSQDVYWTQDVDVIGGIGSLSMTDTGDFRFANLFKNSTVGWLIDGLVPAVVEGSQNTVAVDTKDILKNPSIIDGKFRSTYGYGGKHGVNAVKLPLAPADNNLEAVEGQLLRPGYKLYMDVETVGNYYGVNLDEYGQHIDYNGTNKVVITPRYWLLNLDTGAYTPLDVYAKESGDYVKIVDFDNPSFKSPIIYDINWNDEKDRRAFSSGIETSMNTGSANGFINARVPWSVQSDYIGTASKITLYDVNATCVGSYITYGHNMNEGNLIADDRFITQSQRWYFELGLPSSTAFVKAGLPCTDTNIKEIKDQNAVVACTLNIKAKGTTWTLQYDGSTVNTSDDGGIRVFKNGRVYEAPREADNSITRDPVVAFYDKDHTSADDLTIRGTH